MNTNTPPTHSRHAPVCAGCGYELSGISIDGVCPECGTPAANSIGSQQGTNGYATATLVLGILSIVLGCGFGTICAILALIFFGTARERILSGQAPASTLGIAKAGRICAWVGVALSVLGFLYVVFVIGLVSIAPVMGP